MPLISGPEELAAFRKYWDGKRMLDLLSKHNGRLRVDWAVGVGKSHNIDLIIEEAVFSERYDLVIALFPTRRIIEERKWIRRPPNGIKLVNLKPRPRHKCGADMNRNWQVFEKNVLGALGRIALCGHCLLRPECEWPMQFGKSLKRSQVIFGTQTHIERSPYFLDQLAQWAEAERVLVILDETNFIMKPFRRNIEHSQLQIFAAVLKKIKPRKFLKLHSRWEYLCDLLLDATTFDLRCHDWLFPQVFHDWALAVQTRGYNLYGEAFSFLGFDLVHFGRSPLESRERVANGDIIYAAIPSVSMDFIIYSGTAHQEFSKYRLGNEFTSPFEDFSFVHPETTWFNIASRLGAKKYFMKNSAQILDFFASLVARRIREGKRPLLLAKKFFSAFCARMMEERLRELGEEAQVVISGWQTDLLENPRVIPLIHYGMIGTNLFQEFDCAYCLTGYYVTEEAINGILQDLLGSDMKIPLKISIEGRPLRRRAGVLNREDRIYDLHTLAQHALNHQEMDTVLQAVGRVRPYTKPREVITFQCAEHPDLAYTREFESIGEARNYFGIPDRRTAQITALCEKVQETKINGLKQREAASLLGVSIRSIKRYWNKMVPPTLI
jgi:uncharacterized protein with HEPN domain